VLGIMGIEKSEIAGFYLAFGGVVCVHVKVKEQ
jgi:hypothetical protein